MFLKNNYKSLLSLLVIFVLCFLPGDTVNKVQFFDIPNFDKLVHFGMYFIFSFVLFLDIKKNTQLQKNQIIPIILIITIIIGGSIEIIQNYLIPQRSGDWFDFPADLSGSFVFNLFLLSLRK